MVKRILTCTPLSMLAMVGIVLTSALSHAQDRRPEKAERAQEANQVDEAKAADEAAAAAPAEGDRAKQQRKPQAQPAPKAPRVAPPPRVVGRARALSDAGQDSHEWSEAVLPHDRESVRRLKQIDELIEEKRYGDAIVLLDRVLSSEEDSFFHTDDDRSQFLSLKSEALRQVSALPADGMASYRLQFGARARKLLEEAARTGEIAKLEELTRRYFHTDAGHEATLLLGQHHLDNGRPLQAAICLQQILDTSAAATSRGPALSILVANCWLRAGQEDRARETLVAMLGDYPQATVEIGGREVPLPGRDMDELEWLTQVVGESSAVRAAIDDWWLTTGGNPARNAESRGDRPLLSPRWRQRTMNDPAIEKLVHRIQDDYHAQTVPAIPTLQALAMGDVVLIRTVTGCVAVDFETGRRVWEARPALTDPFIRLVSDRRKSEGDWESQTASALDQRMWNDAVFGTLSSDGERAYMIRDLDWPTSGTSRAMAIRGGVRIRMGGVFPGQPFGSMGLQRSNRLAALDLKTEGKLVWELGGPDKSLPELENAFFLGAPLAVTGHLYCLAEIKSGIRLIVLDAETGEVKWSQQLADVERDIAQNQQRRQAAASPSYADGVLICPTSAGAIVAVDLARRSFLWAYKYPHSMSLREFQLRMHTRTNGQATAGRQWIDSHAIISDGHVLVTPIESQQIYCLNLLDGSLQWRRERDESLYVGCVHDGNVILVGKNDITAVEISSGKTVWEKGDCSLPKGSVPSGRGFYAGGDYYLPLSSREVAKIDLDEGAIVGRSRSRAGLVPGNLICHRGSVISLSSDSLDAFYQIEPLRQRVDQALAKNPEDAEALVRKGELSLDQDDLRGAIDSFRASYKLIPDESTHELLTQTMLRALLADFPEYEHLESELDSLVEDPARRQTLYRLVGRGRQSEGNYHEALTAYLKLIDLRPNGSEMVDEEPGRKIRLDRWIASQLATLRSKASGEAGDELAAAIATRKAAIHENATKADIRQFLNYFDEFVPCDKLRARLAKMLLSDGEFLQCERVARRLVTSSEVEAQAAATALMAQLLSQTGRHDQAAAYYDRLSQEFADQVCIDGKTGSEIMAALPEQERVRGATLPKAAWPVGEVVVTKLPRQVNHQSAQAVLPLQLIGPRKPFFQDVTVHVEQNAVRSGGLAIVGHDAAGREQFRTVLQPGKSQRIPTINLQVDVNRGVVDGHLLVCSLGARIVAIDALAPNAENDRVLWQRDLQPTATAPHRTAQNRPRQVPAAGGARRFVLTNSADEPIGSLGPVYPHGLIIQRGREVACVDPLSGDDVWVLENMVPGCDLFGDEDTLFIVPPSGRESIATVVRPRDGRLLGTRTVPNVRERLTTRGRNLLKLSTVSDKVEVTLVDPWAETTVWVQQFDAYSETCLVGDDLVAVMERSGSFQLMNIDDGIAFIDAQLEPDDRLADIQVQTFGDQYVLMAASPPLNTNRADKVASLGRPNDVFSGHVYAFDRKSGRSMWQKPVFLYQRGRVYSRVRDLPVLTFAEYHTKRRGTGQSSPSVSVLCLDRRTGRPVFQKNGLSRNDRTVDVTGNLEEKTVTIKLRTASFQLGFTEQPLPPEPSFQDDFEGQPKSKKKGSIFNLLGGVGRTDGQLALAKP